jgi:hypothetical protein
VIRFSEPKTVSGFSIGGIGDDYASYSDYHCYANCLLIEGRESDSDFWLPLSEIEFDPAARRTRYFDLPVNRMVGQLRITVQDIMHGTGATGSSSVFLPPMQVWGM